QHLRQDLLRRLLPERRAVRVDRARPLRAAEDRVQVLKGARLLVCVPGVLSKAEVADFRSVMDAAAWEDGRSTAGAQSAEVKNNEQLPPNGETARRLGERVLTALTRSPLFISAAIPLHIFPPLFNRYGVGHRFGVHVDNAVRGDHLTGMRIRTDLSVTLFL